VERVALDLVVQVGEAVLVAELVLTDNLNW
jgi:hypothetical protein